GGGVRGIEGDNFTGPAICRAGTGKIADGSRILFVIRAKHAFICAQSLVGSGASSPKDHGHDARATLLPTECSIVSCYVCYCRSSRCSADPFLYRPHLQPMSGPRCPY